MWNFWKHSFGILHHTEKAYEYLKSCWPTIYIR